MSVHEYKRSTGQRLVYEITYDKSEYFITRDGMRKKSVPDAIIAGVAPDEARASLMLRMAIADIEALIGMDEQRNSLQHAFIELPAHRQTCHATRPLHGRYKAKHEPHRS